NNEAPTDRYIKHLLPPPLAFPRSASHLTNVRPRNRLARESSHSVVCQTDDAAQKKNR
ncbi:uncharacterized protein MYCGRDRAFT_102522, partial [Zymoseptoria tritici IPO323]